MIEILAWTREAWSDYLYWQTQDKKTLKRINKLIQDTLTQEKFHLIETGPSSSGSITFSLAFLYY